MSLSTLALSLAVLTSVQGLVLLPSRRAGDSEQPWKRDTATSISGHSQKHDDACGPRLTITKTVVVRVAATECRSYSRPTNDQRIGKEGSVEINLHLESNSGNTQGVLPASNSALAANESTNFRIIYPTLTCIVYEITKTVSVKTIESHEQTTFLLPPLSDVEPQITGVLNSNLGEPGQPTHNRLLTEPIRTFSSLPTFSSRLSESAALPASFKSINSTKLLGAAKLHRGKKQKLNPTSATTDKVAFGLGVESAGNLTTGLTPSPTGAPDESTNRELTTSSTTTADTFAIKATSTGELETLESTLPPASAFGKSGTGSAIDTSDELVGVFSPDQVGTKETELSPEVALSDGFETKEPKTSSATNIEASIANEYLTGEDSATEPELLPDIGLSDVPAIKSNRKSAVSSAWANQFSLAKIFTDEDSTIESKAFSEIAPFRKPRIIKPAVSSVAASYNSTKEEDLTEDDSSTELELLSDTALFDKAKNTESATSSVTTAGDSFEEDFSTKGDNITEPEPLPDITLSDEPEAKGRFIKVDMSFQDIFDHPIDTKPIPPGFPSRSDHPVSRKGIQSEGPLQTNKFFSNLFLGNQQAPVYTFPYSVFWVAGTGVTKSQGIACSHIEATQRQFGQATFNAEASYYLNPIGISSMILSAKELGNETALTTDSISAFSARAHLSPSNTSAPLVSFPLVQGMAYITAEYNGATPLVQSGVFFRNVTRFTEKPKEHVTRYSFTLEDGNTWRLYGYRTKGDDLDLSVLNNGVAISSKPFYGIIQVVKEDASSKKPKIKVNALDTLDNGAGIYPVTVKLSGGVSGSSGHYEFEYERAGHKTGELLMFALPHHIESFDQETSSRLVRDVSLLTTTKGPSLMVRGNRWKMVEPLMPTDLSFAPFLPGKGSLEKLSDGAKRIINAAASKEICQDMITATDLNSMYFSGKALAKYAHMLYVINDMLGNMTLAQTGLGQLKEAFGKFANNSQKIPLVYDAVWGGVTSSGAYDGKNPLEDFGNTLYNDHHFHYGYHILTAAVIGYLDKSWMAENRDYVNMLARDTSNPCAKDKLFPMWRSFDWYHGHSWATGLFPSLDGKNQESSSEDMMHAYALKMWGKVSGDEGMEARANLQLAVMTRSLEQYYLYKSSNKVQPDKFIGNKVAGILFENKIDHTTFFSGEIEAIQGIHMIPILPVTTVARDAKFVEEEWEAYFSRGRVEKIDNNWRSILLGNLATISPKEAFAAFKSSSFKYEWLDGGISLTWLLAYSAALGGL